MATQIRVPGNRTDTGAIQGIMHALVVELPNGEVEYHEVLLRPDVLPGDWVYRQYGPGTLYMSDRADFRL